MKCWNTIIHWIKSFRHSTILRCHLNPKQLLCKLETLCACYVLQFYLDFQTISLNRFSYFEKFISSGWFWFLCFACSLFACFSTHELNSFRSLTFYGASGKWWCFMESHNCTIYHKYIPWNCNQRHSHGHSTFMLPKTFIELPTRLPANDRTISLIQNYFMYAPNETMPSIYDPKHDQINSMKLNGKYHIYHMSLQRSEPFCFVYQLTINQNKK